ncbi:MAG: tetratricopeptide repeat protein [Proteobacteria bacterium]|nr:tetratricopeptide repeat protein [Pseudomonadota bacterium]
MTHRYTIQEKPFRELLRLDKELSEARRDYANKTPKDRRMEADFVYHKGSADRLFGVALGRNDSEDPWRADVLALAIDPNYAPAILTVGSLEYGLGRREEALELLNGLTKLPKDTEDLVIIIDKAGNYFLDQDDIPAALDLYKAAVESFPEVALYHNAVGYCLGKLESIDEALVATRRAVELEPENSEWLNDLGYTLLEMGDLEEAEAILNRAINFAPPDYELPRNNMEELKRRRAEMNAAKKRPKQNF